MNSSIQWQTMTLTKTKNIWSTKGSQYFLRKYVWSVCLHMLAHIFMCACVCAESVMHSQTDTPFPLSAWALSASIRKKTGGFKGQCVACCLGNNRGERGRDAGKWRDERMDGGKLTTYTKLHRHRGQAVTYSIFTAEWETLHLVPSPIYADYRLYHVIEL